MTEIPCHLFGEMMVVRVGRSGEFLGCSTFPKCRGTRRASVAHWSSCWFATAARLRDNHALQRVRREKEEVFSGLRDPPGNWVAPAGRSRSGGGGNEAVGAFDEKVAKGRSASVQAVTQVNSR